MAKDHKLQPPASMKRILGTLLLLVAPLINAPTAEAGPIVYFDTHRSLDANGQFFESTATGVFDVSATGSDGTAAEHRSDISQSGISTVVNMSGLSNVNGGPGINNTTQLFTSFAIDVPYSADLDITLLGRDDARSEGYLFDQNTGTMLAQVMVDSGFAHLMFQGILDPGLYDFFLLSEVTAPTGPFFGHATSVGDFALQEFTPVPEPATMTLFGIGLAAAWWRKRIR